MNLPKEVATQDNPALSPSGNYVLVITQGRDSQGYFQNFEIQTTGGEKLYVSSDQFSESSTTFFLWDMNNRVWVYSGDLGTFFWEGNLDGTDWRKFVYSENEIPAPEFLKEVRPRWHKK